MIDRWHAAQMLLRHWLLQESEHSIHSPYLYRLYVEVCRPVNLPVILHGSSEAARRLMERDTTPVAGMDIGTPPSTPLKRRTIARIAKHESSSSGMGELLARLAKFHRAKRILELGTSLGLGTLALSDDTDAEVITLEAHPTLAARARILFASLNRHHIRLIEGDIDENLPGLLHGGYRPDLVFIDANHKYGPTLRYIASILAASGPEEVILVVDDINYSKGMTHAWRKALSDHPAACGINLGRAGIILTHSGLAPGEVCW